MENKSKNNLIIPVIVVLVLIAVLAAGYLITKLGSQMTNTTPTTNITKNQATQYKDGTYKTIGNYTSPGGAEELDVTVTLKDGIVTDSTVVSKAFRPNSIRFQGMFIENYKPLVIGKNIDDISLTKVSGSSLAPKGFNEALEEIKLQAKS